MDHFQNISKNVLERIFKPNFVIVATLYIIVLCQSWATFYEHCVKKFSMMTSMRATICILEI